MASTSAINLAYNLCIRGAFYFSKYNEDELVSHEVITFCRFMDLQVE